MSGSKLFVVDAETDGLYGPTWAIGAVVYDASDHIVDVFAGMTDPAEVTDQWVRENVVPYVKDMPTYPSRHALRDAFWQFWMAHREEAAAVADFGTPVEAALFRACVEDEPEGRTWLGPYPLHELGTLLLAAGVDPDVDREEFSQRHIPGGHKHDPAYDAVISAICWRRAMRMLGEMRDGKDQA